jgi:hypothetical protein
MRLAYAVLLSLVLARAAAANPTLHNTFCLDMGGGSNCVWPDPGEIVTATVYLAGTEPWYGGWSCDVRSVAFKLERTFGGQLVGQVNLLGGASYGDPETGWRLYDDEGCTGPGPDGILLLGQAQYLYEGPPGYLRLRAYYSEGLLVRDCDYNLHWIEETELTSLRYGGVAAAAPWGCYTTPVEAVSWGAIKALYRRS